VFAVNTEAFSGDDDGHLRALQAVEVEVTTVGGRPRFDRIEGTEFELPCELVLLALGFSGPETDLLESLGVTRTDRGNARRDKSGTTEVPGVFVCGDMGRGQSLIVWAIAEGRSVAATVDRFLTGSTLLPSPLPVLP
jgi:glutamate synthase (NADPH/NADH) small chain